MVGDSNIVVFKGWSFVSLSLLAIFLLLASLLAYGIFYLMSDKGSKEKKKLKKDKKKSK